MFILQHVAHWIDSFSHRGNLPDSKKTDTDKEILLTPIMKKTSDLNARWQETASSCQSITEWGREKGLIKRKDYDFSGIIDKIQNGIKEGKKICLFMGRTPTEKLPSDLGEAKEDELWISADIGINPSEKEAEIADIKGRLFLWIDLNNDDFLKMIEGLFDKVVIDWSTTKGLSHDFAKRFKILLHDKNSKLIFENPLQGCTSIKEEDRGKCTFSTDTYTVYDQVEDVANQAEQYQKEGDNEEEAWQKANQKATKIGMQRLTDHLKTLYDQVEYHKGEKYPYSNFYTSDGPVSYFVISHKKE